ncbi:hypothetical protein F4779DRAFT_616539 [Xylariaceae sp. FL0662B]|nr:hypothetical protein F4779DRAFT_616539 [Xylariaceae sp. FL0662B]
MPSLKKMTVSTVAVVALVQLCPAPFLAAIPAAVSAGIGAAGACVGAAGAVAGAVEGGINHGHRLGRSQSRVKRQAANQQAWNDCHHQLGSAKVVFSAPSTGNILVKGIPPACMTLVTVITGQYDEGDPIPKGTDSVLFQNLSNNDIQEIQDALNAHSSK